MVIDIDKVVVEDRIRKDFGNIQELAEDIKENGLINPPVVNKEYRLLAGERRLRACKELGWKQIEVRMMDTRDGAHDFEVEVSENESRKDFTRTEREAIYTRRVKARMANEPNLAKIPAEIEVASEMGTSRTNLQTERKIIENKDLLPPEDFANWDEGRLSTNKAYQAIKAALAEKEKRIVELEKDMDKPTLRDKFYQDRIKALGDANEELKTRVVELERIEYQLKASKPEDYEETKEKLSSTQDELSKTETKLSDAKREISENEKEIEKLNKKISEMKNKSNKIDNLSVNMFVDQCRGFVKTAKAQGKTLLKGKDASNWGDMHDCIDALTELVEWAQSFSSELSSINQSQET